MNTNEAKNLKPGDVIRYNDGRAGHTTATATVLSLDSAGMLVQFHDRADSTRIQFASADWMNFLTVAPLPSAEAIAAAFCQELRQTLTPDQIAESNKRNAARNDNSCATHDFCDANEVMDSAFKNLCGFSACDTGGEGIGCMSDAAAALFNQAWDIAKAARFDLPTITQSEFFARDDIKALQDIQKRNAYGTPEHRKAFDDMKAIAATVGAAQFFGEY